MMLYINPDMILNITNNFLNKKNYQVHFICQDTATCVSFAGFCKSKNILKTLKSLN